VLNRNALLAFADLADALGRLAKELAREDLVDPKALLPLVDAARAAGASKRVLRDAIRCGELPAFGRQRDRAIGVKTSKPGRSPVAFLCARGQWTQISSGEWHESSGTVMRSRLGPGARSVGAGELHHARPWFAAPALRGPPGGRTRCSQRSARRRLAPSTSRPSATRPPRARAPDCSGPGWVPLFLSGRDQAAFASG